MPISLNSFQQAFRTNNNGYIKLSQDKSGVESYSANFFGRHFHTIASRSDNQAVRRAFYDSLTSSYKCSDSFCASLRKELGIDSGSHKALSVIDAQNILQKVKIAAHTLDNKDVQNTPPPLPPRPNKQGAKPNTPPPLPPRPNNQGTRPKTDAWVSFNKFMAERSAAKQQETQQSLSSPTTSQGTTQPQAKTGAQPETHSDEDDVAYLNSLRFTLSSPTAKQGTQAPKKPLPTPTANQETTQPQAQTEAQPETYSDEDDVAYLNSLNFSIDTPKAKQSSAKQQETQQSLSSPTAKQGTQANASDRLPVNASDPLPAEDLIRWNKKHPFIPLDRVWAGWKINNPSGNYKDFARTYLPGSTDAEDLGLQTLPNTMQPSVKQSVIPPAATPEKHIRLWLRPRTDKMRAVDSWHVEDFNVFRANWKPAPEPKHKPWPWEQCYSVQDWERDHFFDTYEDEWGEKHPLTFDMAFAKWKEANPSANEENRSLYDQFFDASRPANWKPKQETKTTTTTASQGTQAPKKPLPTPTASQGTTQPQVKTGAQPETHSNDEDVAYLNSLDIPF